MGRYGRSMYYTGYRDADEWENLGLIGDRLSFTDDEVITKLGLGYITHDKTECAMDTAIRYELLNAGTDGEISAKQMLNPRTRLAALFEAGIVVDGWYKDDEGNLHRAWVFQEDDYNQLHHNRVSSGYSHDNVHFPAGMLSTTDTIYLRMKEKLSTYDYSWRGKLIAKIQGPLKTLPFKGNERMLTHILEDKVVVRYINKALNRMVKSGKAIQVTAGRGRTFRWDAWSWLDDIRNRYLVSESKKRKVGDKVNGWIYTQGDSQTTHGVVVHQHWWQPIDEIKLYKVRLEADRVKSPYWSGETNSSIEVGRLTLPYFFNTNDEAFELSNKLNDMLRISVDPQNYAIKYIDENFNMTGGGVEYGVVSSNYEMKIGQDAIVEDYEEPQQAFLTLMSKGVTNYSQERAKYQKAPKYMMHMKKITTKEE